MKRLFVVVNADGKKLKAIDTKQVRHFDNKQDAKAIRDFLNDELGTVAWHVGRGEDNLASSKPHCRAVSSLTQKWQRGNRGRV